MRIGIDVGGTFTDVVCVDEAKGTFHCTKTPTTHHDLAEGVLRSLEEILVIAEISIQDIDYIIPCTNSFSGIDPETGQRFVYIEIQGGGAGARPNKDGPDGQDLHLGRFMNTPIEAAELEHPVLIERYEFIRDSGGPGRYRGGLSLRRDIRFLTEVTWARYSDRQKFEPRGIFGGMNGSKGRLILNPGTDKETLCKSKS